jgi:hypothetical protein
MLVAGTVMFAQARRPSSPAGKAETQVDGKWIEITYNRPILRNRVDIFGSGADYAKKVVTDDAPVWRAGANQTTRLKTERALMIGGKTVPVGEYSVFIDTKENNWTFIVSNWAAQQTFNPNDKAELWGSFGYTPDKDVVRAPMKLSKNPMSIDELTWGFANVTSKGGDIVILWDTQIASVPFTFAGS